MSDKKLKLGTKIGYGVGDFGFNLMFSGLGLYLMFYYTDVLGVAPTTAGLTFMLALIWDGFTDPLMGWLAQRTHSHWGRYRPYLLIMPIPLAFSFCALYWSPESNALSLSVYIFASHLLFRTAYTVASIPYSSLMAVLTRDSMERNSLAAFRMMGATCGALVVAFSTLGLAKTLGDGDMVIGFRYTAMLFAALSAACILVTFFSTSEQDYAVQRTTVTLKVMLGSLKYNTPFVQVFCVILLSAASSTLFTKTLVYYFKYNLDAEHLIPLAFVLFIGTIAALTPVWMLVTRHSSKRFVWILGASLFAAGLSLLACYNGTNAGLVFAFVFVSSMGASAIPLTFWSMLPDTVEFGEWQSGIRAESFIFGLVSLAQKIALGIAVGFLGLMLDGIGFVANTELSSATKTHLRWIMTLAPIGALVLSIVIIWRYRLNNRLHQRLLKILDRRAVAHLRVDG